MEDRLKARGIRVVRVPWLPMGTTAMTFPGTILIQKEKLVSPELIAHELVHVEQWRRLGFFGFLGQYLSGYFRGRLRGLGHWEAYWQLPLEAEARRLAVASSEDASSRRIEGP